MTHIKRFSLYYGSYFGTKEELEWNNGRLLYRSGEYAPDEQIVIPTDREIWKSFLSAIEDVIVDWKRYYNGMVCDGLEWSVEIQTDTLKVSSAGNHHFPEHYDTFLEHVRSTLRCRKFARGHSQRNYLVRGTMPNLINRKIRRLLRRKRLTLQNLADALGYPKQWVRIQLNATSMFEMEDLHKIARLLDTPLMDLLYESELSRPSRHQRKH